MHTSADKLRALCEPYLTQVTDMKALSLRLYDILNTINPYFYELFLCVLNILSEIRELRAEVQQWSHILLFLKHKMIKKRERRVGQIETDWWIKKHGEATIMPKISKYRLPFLMVVTESLQDFLGKCDGLKIARSFFLISFFFPFDTCKKATWSQSKTALNGSLWSSFILTCTES